MKRLNMLKALCVFLLFTAGSSQAGQFAVSMEQDQIAVAEKVLVSLIYLENRSEMVEFFPEEIACELIADGQKYDVVAKKEPSQETSWKIEDHVSAKQNYSFMMPGLIQGQVVMSFTNVAAPRVVLDVVVPQGDIVAETETVQPSLDAMFTIYEPFQKNAASYEPVYFLVGTDPEKSKFQISFKYRFFNPDSSFAESFPWVTGFHFAYTQTSFWDLKSDSAPFEDTSYKPEFFWLSKNYLDSGYGYLKGVFLQTGLQHESNGRGGDLSRSTNYAYMKPILVFYDEDSEIGLQLSTKVWAYVNNEEDTNPNLEDYRGYFDLGAKFSIAESFVAATQFRWADEGGSFQLDVSYPINKFFGDAIDIYLFAQYTNALAESLLDFEERTEAVRLGLAFIR